jgi:hypothetical protein
VPAAAGAPPDAVLSDRATVGVDVPRASSSPDAPTDLPACSDPLSTDFSAFPAWATRYENGGATALVTMGTLEVQLDPTGPDSYAGIISAPVAFTSRRLSVEVRAVVNPRMAARTYFILCPFDAVTCERTNDFFGLYQQSGSLVAVAPELPPLATVPYDPMAHRFWQLRAERGALYYEASPDGSTWQRVASLPAPASLAAVQILVGAWDRNAANAGEAQFDNLVGCALN